MPIVSLFCWAEINKAHWRKFNLKERGEIMALNKKQRIALELLTNGEGLSYKEVAERCGANVKTVYNWRHLPEYAEFQTELQRINDERWLATIDVAREAAVKLCKEGKTEMVKFVLQNAGYNPTQKVEAELHNDIQINIEE